MLPRRTQRKHSSLVRETLLERPLLSHVVHALEDALERRLAASPPSPACPRTKYNQYPEYTVSNNDARNNAKVSGTYELPIGHGRRFANSKGITGQILGGVQVGWIFQYLTGTPFGINKNDNPLGCSGCFNRPNFVSGKRISTTNYKNLGFTRDASQSAHRVFSTDAFAITTNTFVLGKGLRNYTQPRNPGFYQEDVKVSKRFALGERVNMASEMNYFNILNRTRFRNMNDNNNYGNNIDNVSNFGFVPPGQQNSLVKARSAGQSPSNRLPAQARARPNGRSDPGNIPAISGNVAQRLAHSARMEIGGS